MSFNDFVLTFKRSAERETTKSLPANPPKFLLHKNFGGVGEVLNFMIKFISLRS
jgi:hypothetical protein